MSDHKIPHTTQFNVLAHSGVLGWTGALLLLLALAVVSVCIGAGDFSLRHLWLLVSGNDTADTDGTWHILVISRLPRTIALLLAGMSLAVAGLIMQMLVRNRFVEPSTAGTIESATLGILVVMLLAPDTPVLEIGRAYV